MYFVILIQFDSSIHKYDTTNNKFEKFIKNFTRIIVNGSENTIYC